MKEIKSKQIKEIVQKSKQNLIIWGVVAICAIVICALSFYMKDFRKSTSLHDVIAAGEKTEDKLVHVEVTEKPYGFAYYPGDNTGKFYFLWDEQYIYVAFLSESEFNKLNVDDIKENHITVKGVTKTIPSDIKKLAIEAYNENVEKEYRITSSTFADYFGLVYLDQTGADFVSVMLLVVGAITYFVAFCMFIANLIGRFKFKKHIKNISDEDWEILNKELDEEETFYYKSAKLALTKNYVIDFSKGLKAIKYKDILWMYKYEYRYNGVNTQLSIIIFTSDKKRHMIASLVGYTKKSKEINKEIMEAIMDKNKKMLVGYTKENRQQMKEEYQIKA